MKKSLIALLAILTICTLVLAGCGSSESTTPAEESSAPEVTEEASEAEAPEAEAAVPEETSSDGGLSAISDDFASTIAGLQDALDQVYADTGDTYEDYSANKQLVFDWFDLAEDELDALFTRTYDNAIAYYEWVANTVDHEDVDGIDSALADFVNVVQGDALDDVNNAVIDEMLEDVWDRYYGDGGIIDQAYDAGAYDVWSDLTEEFSDAWFEVWEDLYDLWSDSWFDLSDLAYAVSEAYYSGEFDMDSILAQIEQENLEGQDESADSEALVDGMRSEFKEAMDGYEKYFDSLCELMVRLVDYDGSDTSVLEEYDELMAQYDEVEASMESWADDDLNEVEAQYYIDVMTRISEELDEVSDLF